MKAAIFLSAIALNSLVLATTPSFAFDQTSKAPVNVTHAKVALKSYDPVSYFKDGKPKLGNESLAAEFEGAIYHFSSEDNRKAFLAEPAKYAPINGGFCQMGVANGRKLDGDPHLYRVSNGRLALFSYPAALESFNKDPEGNAKKAENNWPTIREKAPREL